MRFELVLGSLCESEESHPCFAADGFPVHLVLDQGLSDEFDDLSQKVVLAWCGYCIVLRIGLVDYAHFPYARKLGVDWKVFDKTFGIDVC